MIFLWTFHGVWEHFVFELAARSATSGMRLIALESVGAFSSDDSAQRTPPPGLMYFEGELQSNRKVYVHG